jgi:hypothetical protein
MGARAASQTRVLRPQASSGPWSPRAAASPDRPVERVRPSPALYEPGGDGREVAPVHQSPRRSARRPRARPAPDPLVPRPAVSGRRAGSGPRGAPASRPAVPWYPRRRVHRTATSGTRARNTDEPEGQLLVLDPQARPQPRTRPRHRPPPRRGGLDGDPGLGARGPDGRRWSRYGKSRCQAWEAG